MVGVALGKEVFAGGILQLSVGENEVPFDAHLVLLCTHSPFFEKAMDGRFLEAETKHMSLPEDDPDTFSNFLSWMYTVNISLDDKSRWIDLCKLWVMADKYQVPQLQHKVLRIMSKKWEKKAEPKGNLHADILKYVYENTMDTSALRRAICNICVYGMEASKFARHIGDYPREFLEDYAIGQTKRANKELPPKPNITFFTDDFKPLRDQNSQPLSPQGPAS